MTKNNLKVTAVQLRKNGESIKDISKILDLSKSTISNWLSNIKLSKSQKDKLYKKMVQSGHKGRLIGANVNKQKKLDKIDFYKQEGVREIGQLSKRDLLILLTALFWAEGSKTDSRFIFINSDPTMIKLVYKSLINIFNIQKERISITVQINESHKNRINKILSFWANLLKLQHSQIGKPYYVNTKSKKVYLNHENYYGIVRLKVSKSSELFYRIYGLISSIKDKHMSM